MKERNDVIVDSKEIKQNRRSSLLGAIFLIWFFGSIIGIMYFSKINGYYSVMLFGQYFLVFGIFPLTQSEGKEKLMGVPFLLVGLCAVIIPFLMLHPELLNVSIVWDSVIPLLFMLAFVIAGIVMIVFPIKHKKDLERKCSSIVPAIIVDYRSTRGEDGELYSPVYGFNFNNKEYRVSKEFYTNIGLKPIGTVIDLKINPENPEEFLDSSNGTITIEIMGIIFLLVSVPILVHILSTFTFVE